jgi:hypothetical protein
MKSRGTGTGAVLEQMIVPALISGGYRVARQSRIGTRPGGRYHVVDIVAVRDDRKILVSLKWQQVSGTAEQKVAFEAICLIEAMGSGDYAKAYIVLGGEGWSLRTFYTNGGLSRHLIDADKVEIVTLESFIAKANRGVL